MKNIDGKNYTTIVHDIMCSDDFEVNGYQFEDEAGFNGFYNIAYTYKEDNQVAFDKVEPLIITYNEISKEISQLKDDVASRKLTFRVLCCAGAIIGVTAVKIASPVAYKMEAVFGESAPWIGLGVGVVVSTLAGLGNLQKSKNCKREAAELQIQLESNKSEILNAKNIHKKCKAMMDIIQNAPRQFSFV